MSIAENAARVRERIAEAASRVGRGENEITLVAVSKTFGPEMVAQAVSAGVTEIGENRVQEAAAKFPLVEGSFRKHMVGHLQTNKARKAVELFDLIQSVDSKRLARKISGVAEGGTRASVLVEVNTSGEASKFGVAPEAALDFVEEICDYEGLRVEGLMTLGPAGGDEREIRRAFAALRELYEAAVSRVGPRGRMRYLSMGMTDDFELAISEGSNMVRIGRAIFGDRTSV